MKLVLNGEKSKSFKILSCSIWGDHLIERATVVTEDELDEDFAVYSIFDEDLEIFIGKIISSEDNKYEFSNNPKEIKNSVVQRIVSDLQLGNSFEIKERSFFDFKEIFSYDLKKFKHKPVKVNLNILWKNYAPEIWKAGDSIFQDMKTLTSRSIFNSWPKVSSTISGWKVMESEIYEKNKSWMKLSDSYFEVSELSGSLVLNRTVENLNREKWSIFFQENGEYEETDLFLDLSKYSIEHTEWKKNTVYEKGNLVFVEEEGYKKLKSCTQKHDSGVFFDPKMWKDEYDYYFCSEDVLFKSYFGRDLFTTLLKNLYLDLLNKRPEIILSAIGTWDRWKSLRIGSIIIFDAEGQSINLEVTKFQKKAGREVSFECRCLGGDFNSINTCNYWDSSLRFGGNIKIILNQSSKIQEVKIKNKLEDQLLEKPIKSTRIELVSNKFHTNSCEVVIPCLERKDGLYN